MTVVNPRSFSQSNRRRISARRIAGLENAENRLSIVSSTMRFAPTCSTAISRRMNNASRRSEEHTSELQSLMRISYAVFCLKKKKKRIRQQTHVTKQDYSESKHKTSNTQ